MSLPDNYEPVTDSPGMPTRNSAGSSTVRPCGTNSSTPGSTGSSRKPIIAKRSLAGLTASTLLSTASDSRRLTGGWSAWIVVRVSGGIVVRRRCATPRTTSVVTVARICALKRIRGNDWRPLSALQRGGHGDHSETSTMVVHPCGHASPSESQSIDTGNRSPLCPDEWVTALLADIADD